MESVRCVYTVAIVRRCMWIDLKMDTTNISSIQQIKQTGLQGFGRLSMKRYMQERRFFRVG